MIKNKLLRRLALLISLIVLLTSTVNTTFGFIITKTDSLINTFIPFESIINNLVINKNVEHPFGDEYLIPDNINFDFKVDLGSLYAKTTIKTTNGNIVTDKNGSFNVLVTPGKPFAIEGIDAGTKVTVTEIQKSDSGFTVKTGTATMQGIVAEDGSLKFDYTNIYSPASVNPVNVFVCGNKVLEGRDWQEGDSFSFVLEQKSDNTWMTIGTKTVSYSADNSNFNHFDFTDTVQALTFDKVGIYKFRITEVIGNLENVDYDKSINTFAICVTDTDMDGKLEIGTVTAAQNATVKNENGNYNVSVIFNNSFVPAIPEPEDITVDITVNKTVKNIGSSSISPEGFKFVLVNNETNEELVLESNRNGKAVFSLPFSVSDVGKTYTYKLSEINDGRKNVSYDTSVYEISVTVALSGQNELSAITTINNNTVDVVTAIFNNTYRTTTPPTGDNSNNLFWLSLMIISGTVTAWLIFLENKYRKSNKN